LSRLLFGGGVGGGVGVLFLEALDAASDVHEFLLAGEEGWQLEQISTRSMLPLTVERVWKVCRKRNGR